MFRLRFLVSALVVAVTISPSVLLYSSSGWAGSCGCEVSPAKESQYNDALILSDLERQAALAIHAPFGIPVSSPTADNERLLVQHNYIIQYDDDLRIPVWVSYRLSKDDVVSRARKNCFRDDPRIESGVSASCGDYQEPIYDRGHLVPRADMNRTEPAMINTFIFTNIAPQMPQFNRGIWRDLEKRVRGWAESKGVIYVISGIVMDWNKDGLRDSDDSVKRMRSDDNYERVAVPSAFYKIVLYERTNGAVESLAILLPHDNQKINADQKKHYLERNIVSIDEIELLTDINFLPGLEGNDINKAQAVERYVAPRLW